MAVYTSYVLRVWRVQEGSRWTCRAMLEHVSTGQRTRFADLASLIAFLQAEVQAEASRDATDEAIKHQRQGDGPALKGWL
jgi:hypothetical protein